MKLGIFSNVIKGGSPNEVAEKTRAYGLDAVQFVPAGVFVGFWFDQEAPDAEFSPWAAAYESAGVEVCAVGGYVNLLHHDTTAAPGQHRQVHLVHEGHENPWGSVYFDRNWKPVTNK